MVKWCTERIERGLRRITALGLTLVLGLLLLPSLTWGTTQVGDMELQLWYRMRHTFQTDGGDDLNWVQWRNEVFGWLIYDPLVEEGRLFNQTELPLVKHATLNARYRFRFDPVYMIRDHFENIYDGDERDSFIIPENGFRDLFVDLDFEQVGPGFLSARIGNQQIVWGESDLFRSLDIINHLRIDQNGFVGEKFDEFRSPSFGIKFLYDIGTVGTWLSDLAIEPFYVPRFRTNTSDLILEDGFRLPAHIKGCLDDNNNLIPFDIHRCSQLRSDGTRRFELYRSAYMGHRRMIHPWTIFPVDGNSRRGSINFACLTQECSADVFGQRASGWVNLGKSQDGHVLQGIGGKAQAGGVRILARTFFGLDFSLNYMFLPVGPSGVGDLNKLFSSPGVLRPEIVYGDFGIIPDGNGGVLPPAGTFEEGLRRCVSDGGKGHMAQAKDRGNRVATILTGADLRGYDHPKRFGPNGALLPDGNPKPGKHSAARPPLTFCVPAYHDFVWTHVVGFTGTYNDFEYTGAVFRLEESLSMKEPIRAFPPGTGRRFSDVPSEGLFRNNTDKYTRVWRSMVGFDLAKAFSSLRYVPFMPRTMYENMSFFTGQWLMENYWDNVANNICQNSDSFGNGITKKKAKRLSQELGRKVFGHTQCRRYRWNHLLTFAWAGYGFFNGRLETRNAVVFEPRGKQWLVFTQNWWRNFLGFPDWEVSFGVGWYPSSRNADSWSALWAYADRDSFWFETTYYLL